MPSDNIHTALAPVPAFANEHPIHISSTHGTAVGGQDEVVALCAVVFVFVGDGDALLLSPFGVLNFGF